MPHQRRRSRGSNITLIGTSFTGATSVTFGATASSNLNVVNDGEISVSTPASSVSLVPTNGSLNETVFVRFNPLWGVRDASGTISAPQTSTAVIQLPGNNPLSVFRAPEAGQPSLHQTYAFIGTNLSESVALDAPAGFQISTDLGASWHSSRTVR